MTTKLRGIIHGSSLEEDFLFNQKDNSINNLKYISYTKNKTMLDISKLR